MQTYFKLPNDILTIGLTPNELKVAVCLYSCIFGSRKAVCVKQSTIALKCGIKMIETVGNIICKLQEKGIIERVSRPFKANGQLGTYIYKLREISRKGFFKVKRYILGRLTGAQLRMYLFVCSTVTKKNDMWNSFNDIARYLGIARTKVIATISELVSLGLISKRRVLKKDGSYSDNHYSVSDAKKKSEEKRVKRVSPKQVSGLFGTGKIDNISSSFTVYYKANNNDCQVKKRKIFLLFGRGVVP
jgi:predicted transcriptional regulator